MNNKRFEKLQWLLKIIDFEPYIKENGNIAVKDLQGCNFGDVESEEFGDVDDVIDRLEIYWIDTFLNVDTFLDKGKEMDDFETFEEALAYCKEHKHWGTEYLECIVNGIPEDTEH